MVVLACIILTCLAVSILCFDLLELAIRRVLVVLLFIVAAILLGTLYFFYGMYEATQKDTSVITARRAKLDRTLSKCNALFINAWSIPLKTAMLEPHIRKAVKSGIKDGIAMRTWFKRSQFNPKHPFTVWHPVKSAVKGTAYVGYKEYARYSGTPKNKVKTPEDFTMFDILF